MRRARFEENRQFYAVVGRLIARARVGRLTQEALARKANLTRTAILNIEKGRQQILLHTLVDISRALDVPVTDLLPKADSLEIALRDKTQKGLEWIKSSTSALKSKEHDDGSP
ncbi:helix-turn-helix transcriptional regulator [Bradyrhizobium glycinis]|uniref:helix-turn-helix transcriptional regulator n=1 Tax=Bradyrhizobium glycinis TaxID=2751812 RepID=UPI0018D6F912|nr:helix-turn-helix transcriptional regulator [Bradyrhizobium glycinis]MBH5373389.1 helix-turn-helix transcriptional regulator [Bradyrhizobium glycinis]